MMKRSGSQSALVITALILALSLAIEAQPIKPVFTNTSQDGQLLGLETDFQFGIWKPIVALAYGLDSHNFRYKAGLMLATGFELPGVGQRLGDFSLTLIDWPDSPVLGREGQSGVGIGWHLGNTQFSGFWGTLWPSKDQAPQIQYLSIDTLDTYELPYDLHLTSSSQMTLGMVLGDERLFQSMTRTLTFRLGSLRLSARYGVLENEAQLAGFEFTTGVRGIAQSLKGHEFWNVTLERTFSMYESAIPLTIPAELLAFLPASLPVELRGAFFVQVGGATRKKDPEVSKATELETEMLFSWGISATFSISDLRIQTELIFTQDGETRFNFGF